MFTNSARSAASALYLATAMEDAESVWQGSAWFAAPERTRLTAATRAVATLKRGANGGGGERRQAGETRAGRRSGRTGVGGAARLCEKQARDHRCANEGRVKAPAQADGGYQRNGE